MDTISLETIADVYQQRGADQYGGEAVNQLQHALQCAHLAEQAGSHKELIVAAFLHDLGHLCHDLGENVAERGVDDAHEYRAERLLRDLFPAR